MSPRLLTVLTLVPLVALATEDDSGPKKVAEAYLNALSGAGSEAGKDLLLGGVTMNAQLFTLENWNFKGKDPVKKEEGDLAQALKLMKDLDQAGRTALTKLMGVEAVGDDLSVREVGQDEASKLLAPTRERVSALQKAHPVLSYALRTGMEVYWHPKNPMRMVLAKAGPQGSYTIEIHRWTIRSIEGPTKAPREWPLRVLRFKSAKVDTGWKILPASNWNAE